MTDLTRERRAELRVAWRYTYRTILAIAWVALPNVFWTSPTLDLDKRIGEHIALTIGWIFASILGLGALISVGGAVVDAFQRAAKEEARRIEREEWEAAKSMRLAGERERAAGQLALPPGEGGELSMKERGAR